MLPLPGVLVLSMRCYMTPECAECAECAPLAIVGPLKPSSLDPSQRVSQCTALPNGLPSKEILRELMAPRVPILQAR